MILIIIVIILKNIITHFIIVSINRQQYSTYDDFKVSRLSELMNEVVPIHGRGNFPTLEVFIIIIDLTIIMVDIIIIVVIR